MLHFFKKKRDFKLLLGCFSCIILLWSSPGLASPTLWRQMLQQPALPAQHTSAQIISMKTGETLLSQNESAALMPASNMKIITSAAALSLLKPEYRFKTHLFTDGYQQNNTLKGNLYIKGYGDPTLSDERLLELIQELRFQGIESIEGDLIVDDSFFDQEHTGRGWKDSYGAAAYSARISALSLNLNVVEVRVRPTQAGQPAAIVLKPDNTFFDLENQTRTSSGRTQLKILRQVIDGRNRIVISGNVDIRGRTEIEKLNLDKPALYVGNVSQTMLRREGIALSGKLRKGITPTGSRILAATYSPVLSDVVAQLNKDSVNLIGENLLKFMGANFEGAPGTAAKGEKVIKERFLIAQVGLPPDNDIVIADGSGLSPLNRLNTNTLAKVLAHMFEQFDVSVDFMSSLAISGVDGTLKKRMQTPEMKRRVRAKTGFINGASGLSGYVYTQDNDVLVFSFLMNHFRDYGAAVNTQDRICTQLAGWSH